MTVDNLVIDGYRAYPLETTIGTINLDAMREFLLKRYSLYSLIDTTKNILYVKYKFD